LMSFSNRDMKENLKYKLPKEQSNNNGI